MRRRFVLVGVAHLLRKEVAAGIAERSEARRARFPADRTSRELYTRSRRNVRGLTS